ncbi:hypothetical protein COD21_14350 [Bacillus cereus]|nr:hypothetical protein COD21_14350 [Bacillus cereus]
MGILQTLSLMGMYGDPYEGAVQYYYIRTTDNTTIDLCISDFPEIFAIHEGFSDKQIRKIYNWNL